MKMLNRKTHILFVIALSTLVTIHTLAEDTDKKDNAQLTADQVAEQIQNYYASVQDYKASFVQTVNHKMFAGRLDRSYGVLTYKKGGLMRWEYNRPDKKLFIYDGTILWIYEPEVPQIFKASADADRLRKALAFLTGEGKIKEDYKIKKANEKKYGFAQKGYVLILKPKQKSSPFKHVELYVSKTDFRVIRSVVVDHDGNRNRLDFSSPKTNSNIKDSFFKFEPPKGVPITEGNPS